MDSQFWMRFLFIVTVAIVIYYRALTKPAAILFFDRTIVKQLRYGQSLQLNISAKKFALVVFTEFTLILVGLWLLSRITPSVMQYIFAWCVAGEFALLTYATGVFHQIPNKAVRLGVVLISGFVSSVLGLSWLFAPTWAIYLMLATLIGYIILSQIGIIRLRYVVAGLIAVSLYDFFGVWGSSAIVGPTGMIGQIALGMSFTPPGMILIPKDIFAPLSLATIGGIGVGDIVVPGVAVLAASRFHLEIEAIIGFAVGVLGILLLLLIVRPVPATILLNPSVLLAILVAARARRIQLEW